MQLDVSVNVMGNLEAYAQEDITIDNTVKGLTVGKFNPTAAQADRDKGSKARLVYMTVDANPIRYTVDGTNPVAVTTGHLAAPPAGAAPAYTGLGAEIVLTSFKQMQNFKATREAAANGTLHVTYYR